jgi:hypothetical protein
VVVAITVETQPEIEGEEEGSVEVGAIEGEILGS